MNKYELTLVLDGKTTPAKTKSALEKIEKLIANVEGKVVKKESLGEKELSYLIGKSEKGIFSFYELELSGKGAKQLGDKLKLEETFIRYLLIKQ